MRWAHGKNLENRLVVETVLLSSLQFEVLLAQLNELFLVQAVRELERVIGKESLEKLVDGVRSLELILDQAEEVGGDHDGVAL